MNAWNDEFQEGEETRISRGEVRRDERRAVLIIGHSRAEIFSSFCIICREFRLQKSALFS